MDDEWLKDLSDGWYGGHAIHKALLEQEFKTVIDGQQQTVCRWAVMFVDEALRIGENLKKAELKAQNDMRHSAAHIFAKESIQPNTLGDGKDGKQVLVLV